MPLVRWEPFNEMDGLFNRMLQKSLKGLPRLSAEENGAIKFEWAPSCRVAGGKEGGCEGYSGQGHHHD